MIDAERLIDVAMSCRAAIQQRSAGNRNRTAWNIAALECVRGKRASGHHRQPALDPANVQGSLEIRRGNSHVLLTIRLQTPRAIEPETQKREHSACLSSHRLMLDVTVDTSSPARERLSRRLGFWSSIGFVVGMTIGSGIFRTPAQIAARVPDPLMMLAVWALGGAVTLCGALSIAELAAALPQAGGLYVFLREGWGRGTAFVFTWSELVLIRAAGLSGIASVFGEYVAAFRSATTPWCMRQPQTIAPLQPS